MTCWVEPEVSVSQHHEQQPLAEELWETQWDVSEVRVWIIPPITCSTAEPPQQGCVQPYKDTKLDSDGANPAVLKRPSSDGRGSCSPAVMNRVSSLTPICCVQTTSPPCQRFGKIFNVKIQETWKSVVVEYVCFQHLVGAVNVNVKKVH